MMCLVDRAKPHYTVDGFNLVAYVLEMFGSLS